MNGLGGTYANTNNTWYRFVGPGTLILWESKIENTLLIPKGVVKSLSGTSMECLKFWSNCFGTSAMVIPFDHNWFGQPNQRMCQPLSKIQPPVEYGIKAVRSWPWQVTILERGRAYTIAFGWSNVEIVLTHIRCKWATSVSSLCFLVLRCTMRTLSYSIICTFCRS
jgi:hypothetical protein